MLYPVSLREVTSENLRDILKLEVADAQRSFVAPNSWSIAQAHFAPEAWFRGIYAGERAVGFAMLSDRPEKPEYYLWRFMIDQSQQGRGFGTAAMRLLVEHVRTRPNAREFLLSCVPGEGTPMPFYERLGFVVTGEIDDGEHVMRLEL